MNFMDFIHFSLGGPGYLLPGSPQATGSEHPPLGTAAATTEISQ